jgi:hypothetical protein
MLPVGIPGLIEPEKTSNSSQRPDRTENPKVTTSRQTKSATSRPSHSNTSLPHDLLGINRKATLSGLISSDSLASADCSVTSKIHLHLNRTETIRECAYQQLNPLRQNTRVTLALTTTMKCQQNSTLG